MRSVRIVPKFFDDLVKQVQPPSGRVPEALPWALYSTRSFTATTTRLTFFDSVEGDKSLSNMESAGALPDPQFFEIFGWSLDVLSRVTTAAGGVVGAIDDIAQLLMSGRGHYTFNLSNKRYGPFPLSLMHGTGGPTGFGWGTFTAEESLQYGNVGIFDGGFWWDGKVTIPPKVGFDVTLEWPAALTLSSDPVRLRVTMLGVLYRRTL